jgi:hypothetical protein
VPSAALFHLGQQFAGANFGAFADLGGVIRLAVGGVYKLE